MAQPSLAPARVSWTQETREKQVEQIFLISMEKVSPSTVAIHDWEGMQGQPGLQEEFQPFPLPTRPELQPWYLLVSEIKLLLPLGHPLEGDPLLCPRLCRAEIGGGSRMVPVGAGGKGTPAAPPQGTMPQQPRYECGGDPGTHLCSSAATTKPQDANSVQIEEYKVLEGQWEQRGQGSSERGQGGHCPSPAQGSRYRKAPRPWEKMIRG